MSKGNNSNTYKFKCTKSANGTAEIKFFLNSYELAKGLGVCQPTYYNYLKNGKNKTLKQWKIERGHWDKYEKSERDVTTIN